jgi:hypothetical protein
VRYTSSLLRAALPIGPKLAVICRRARTRRVFQSFIPFRSEIRGNAAKLFSPAERGRFIHLTISASRRPFWQRQPQISRLTENRVPVHFQQNRYLKSVVEMEGFLKRKLRTKMALSAYFSLDYVVEEGRGVGSRLSANFSAWFDGHCPPFLGAGVAKRVPQIRCAWALRCSGSGWIHRPADGAGWRTDRPSFRKLWGHRARRQGNRANTAR